MELDKAIEILEKHNKYRRDNEVPSSIEAENPTKLGISIDTVVNFYKKTIKS